MGLASALALAVGFSVLDRTDSAALLAPAAASAVAAAAAVSRDEGKLLRIRNRPWVGAALFGAGHAPAVAVAHAYLWKTAAPAYPLLVVYLCMFPAAAAYLNARLSARWPKLPSALTLPFLWVGLEYLRGEWLLGGYPWFLLGHTLSGSAVRGVTWLAPLVGAYGSSLLLSFVSLAVCDPVHRIKNQRTAGVIAGLCAFAGPLVLSLLLGASLTPPAPAPIRTLRVAVLQTNLPQDNKIGWPIAERVTVHQHWLDLSIHAATAGGETKRPQLIVWPETMFPGAALNPEALDALRRSGLYYTLQGREPLPITWFSETLLKKQADLDIPFLVGSIAADNLAFQDDGAGGVRQSGARYNSAILVTDGRAQQERYDKIDLMAFGEYIPVVHRWKTLQNWLTGLGARGMSFDLGFGTQRNLFNVEGVRIGTPICFEVSHEKACREFTTTPDGVSRRADLLINLTNDGWFYTSDFNRRMHLLQARWRCAETATPMVRAANTGISTIIDAAGKVLTPALDGGAPNTQTEGTLTADAPIGDPNAGPTFYARVGHLAGPLIAAAGALLVVAAFWPSKAPEPRR